MFLWLRAPRLVGTQEELVLGELHESKEATAQLLEHVVSTAAQVPGVEGGGGEGGRGEVDFIVLESIIKPKAM